jgi:hypothetical protein
MIVFVILGALMAASIILAAIYTSFEVAIAVTIAFALIISIIAYLTPVWLSCGEKREL